MPSTSSIIATLKTAYPQFEFKSSTSYRWSPSANTIYYRPADNNLAYLIHELAHAILGHISYDRDIELLPMERDAWIKAQALAKDYDICISETVVETNLDSYRNWMHARSTCPACGATGLQTKKHLYHCLACSRDWRVNDARICGLKRYLVK